MPNRRPASCSSVPSSSGAKKRRSSTSQCGTGGAATCVRTVDCGGKTKARKSAASGLKKKKDCKASCLKKVAAKYTAKTAKSTAKKVPKVAKATKPRKTSSAACQQARGRCCSSSLSDSTSYSSFSSDDISDVFYSSSCSECGDH